MDVKEGLCWRCEKRLPAVVTKRFPCKLCLVAIYCCKTCLKNDSMRHTCVECAMWCPKPCGHCGRGGRFLECTGCCADWYCDSVCQKAAWKTHKSYCKRVIQETKDARDILALFFKQNNRFRPIPHYPHYFGTTLALDLLRLVENEAKERANKTASLGASYSLLLAGCGDMRHMFYTVYSLPLEFKGSIEFTLNDFDAYPMARNTLFLYMMVTVKESSQNVAALITTIWYSLRLTDWQSSTLENSLQDLVKMSAEHFRNVTEGKMEVISDHFEQLRRIWQGWLTVNCDPSDPWCLKLNTRREKIFASDRGNLEWLKNYRHRIPAKHLPSLDKYLKNALFAPSDEIQDRYRLFNPTLTGRPITHPAEIYDSNRVKFDFEYCVPAANFPFRSWDYREMVKLEKSEDLVDLCHSLVSKAGKRIIDLMRQNRFTVTVSVADFSELPSQLAKKKFDRIFANNLTDTYGTDHVLTFLEPLLSQENPKSALICENHRWQKMFQGAADPEGNAPKVTLGFNALEDRKTLTIRQMADRPCYIEYFDNITYLVSYIRSDRMSAQLNTAPSPAHVSATRSEPTPSWQQARCFKGLKMHNFLYEKNHIVPLRFRGNARMVNMLSGYTCYLEWNRSE